MINLAAHAQRSSRLFLGPVRSVKRCRSTQAVRKIPLIIDNEPIFESQEGTFGVYGAEEPEKLLEEVTELSPSLLQRAMESTFSGFQKWQRINENEKRVIYNGMTSFLEKSKASLVEQQLEIGVSEWFAQFNVDVAIGTIKQYSDLLTTHSRGEIPVSSGLTLVLSQPIGPVLSIAPWNAPLILATRAILAPITAGCSVVLKSSELAAGVQHDLVAGFINSGLPPGVLNLVHSSQKSTPARVKSMIEHNSIRKISFTGSTAVGREIAKMAGSNLKPVLLELGGKGSVIVAPDADLDAAAQAVVIGMSANSGEICMSTERVYVHKDVWDEFNEKIAAAAQMILGDVVLPQRTLSFASKIRELVQEALSKGASVLYGSLNEDRNTTKVSAGMILTDISPDMKIHKDESFGPVVYISKVDTLEEAVVQSNNSGYGLSSAVWTKDILKGIDIAKQTEAGMVHINGMTVHDEATIPHGGVKDSGYGRFNSKWGMDEFMIKKTITLTR